MSEIIALKPFDPPAGYEKFSRIEVALEDNKSKKLGDRTIARINGILELGEGEDKVVRKVQLPDLGEAWGHRPQERIDYTADPKGYERDQKIAMLTEEVTRLTAQNRLLEERLSGLEKGQDKPKPVDNRSGIRQRVGDFFSGRTSKAWVDTRINSRQEAEVRTERRNRRLALGAVVGAAAVGLAWWIDSRTGGNSVDSLQERLNDLQLDEDKTQTGIQNINGSLDRIEAILDPNGPNKPGDAFTNLTDIIRGDSGVDTGGFGGNLDSPGDHLDFYNVDTGSRVTAVELPSGTFLEEGPGGRHNIVGPGRKTLIEGADWDQQGNLAQWVRRKLTDQGFSLHQKVLQYVKTDGQIGSRYFTDVSR